MSYNLQTTGSGKNTSILMRKLREKMAGNHQKLRENSGKMILKILYEPCVEIFLVSFVRSKQT